ncbi:MAG TPA: hypothetical protein VMT50_12485 [Steroidobacteraceae bacterium]|nr:hypothetical protein [Steroidobacteraceae bacterium]
MASALLALGLALTSGAGPPHAVARPAASTADAGRLNGTGKPAEMLLARYAELRTQLEHSPYQRPLYLESTEGSDAARGDIYAVINYPIGTVVAALVRPEEWCEVLILHLNIKYCHAAPRDGHATLRVATGKKHEQPLGDTYRLEFAYTASASTPDYLDVDLDAPGGPLGTRDYRIALQAVPLAGARTFLHLQYSFGFGLEGKLAMDTYLATSGSGKVGFTLMPEAGNGPARLVGGLRGAVERNAMRYYLAIEAYLGALSLPAHQRLERRLELWFDATEAYGRQLHEVDRATYLAMKRREYDRQQTLQ